MKRMLLVLVACSSKPAPKEQPRDAAPVPVVVTTPPDAAHVAIDAGGTSIDRLAGFRAIATATPMPPGMGDPMGIVPPAPGCPADHPLLVAQLESTFIVSLAHGVELERGAAHSATSLGDCEGSADDLEGAWLGQVLPDADPELVIVHERGGKNVGEYDLEIWKVAADKPERIFSTPVESYEGTSRSVATATLAPDGTIHVQRGETSEVWAVGPDGTFVKR